MLRFGAVFVGAALLTTGCASTNAPEDLGKLEYTGFSTKADGSAYQSVMGLNCPSEIDGIRRTSTKSYNDAGTDVGCNYSQDERIFTVYLSRFPGDSLESNFRGAQAALEYSLGPQGYVYDEGLSKSCRLKSLDTSQLLSSVLSGGGKSKTISISSAPSAVYTNAAEGKMSVLVVEEMYEKDFFKTRYTGAYRAPADVDDICNLARNNFLEMRSSVDESRGIEKSDATKLIDLMRKEIDGS